MVQQSQSGQVGIAVLLVLVVLSTIGISIATRSTQDIQNSRQSQEATQTFSAAESALENVLSQGQTYLNQSPSGQYNGVSNATVDYSVAKKQDLTVDVLQGSVIEINVATGVSGNQVNIQWSNTADCNKTPASLLISVVNVSGSVSSARSFSYAICDHADGFTLVNTAGTTLARVATVTLQDGDKTIRVVPIYNDTKMAVDGVGWTLPTQQYTIDSVAKNDLGRETKAIQVQRTLDYAPSIFDYSLVSGTSILK